jgi:hypothetical protein
MHTRIGAIRLSLALVANVKPLTMGDDAARLTQSTGYSLITSSSCAMVVPCLTYQMVSACAVHITQSKRCKQESAGSGKTKQWQLPLPVAIDGG